METLEKRKVDLRKQVKVLLKSMDLDEKSRMDHQVYLQVLKHQELTNAKSVYGYMALFWETGTLELIEYFWSCGISVAFPKVEGSEMEFYKVESMDDLEIGTYRIMEPKHHCEKVNWPDAVIMVPGIAFTRDGKRLGKGGGYYDKYLEKYPGHRTVAFAYDFQMVSDLPTDDHDHAVDIVITEQDTFFCK